MIVNFGGPRTLNEVEPFLRSLLTDKEVIRTKFPQPFHNFLFGRIAKKRALQVVKDYKKIGGGSPIWSDTEFVASSLREELNAPVLAFHRYLPASHPSFIEKMNALECQEITVFPMFPQFTFATTGSIARYFSKHLSPSLLKKMWWIKSYPSHPAYIEVMQQTIRDFLVQNRLVEEETLLLFSAHGLPKIFVDQGDLYAFECRLSFERIVAGFPKVEGMLSFQSKFGKGEWLRPYTEDVCHQIEIYAKKRSYVVFVPLSFTSDHIETLFEVEEQYMPVVTKKGFRALRVPALNRRSDWIGAIQEIILRSSPCSNSMLVR